MTPEACEAMVFFFVVGVLSINIDPSRVPGLSLGRPEEGGTVRKRLGLPSTHLATAHRAQDLRLQRFESDSAESPASESSSLGPSVIVCKRRKIPKD